MFKILIFYLAFLLFYCPFCVLAHPSVNTNWKIHQSLSYPEEADLKRLFRYLFGENELGYSLFDHKPMSFCFISTAVPGFSVKENVFKIYKRGAIPLFNGLKVCNNMQKFNNSKFIFIFTKKEEIPEFIILINRALFTQAVNKDIDVFKKWYGSKLTAESFLDDLVNARIRVEELLSQHLPLGILLGYGKHNAELFHRREMLLEGRNKIPFSFLIRPSSPFKSIEEELIYFDQRLSPIYSGSLFLLLAKPVNFVADFQWKETRDLQAHYLLAHRELTELFLREDWFYKIWERLCQDDFSNSF